MDIIKSSQIISLCDDKPLNSLSTQDHINEQTSSQNPRANDCQNLLIDAASRIFATITQLKNSPHYHNIDQLRDYLLKEIALFKQNAQKFDYNDDIILIGQYAVCATLDETICKTPWGSKANWEKFNLLQALQENLKADEHFFTILERVSQQPHLFIDTIELMYICLSLGFEGKFKYHPLEKQRLQQISDYTYKVIRQYRGEFDKKLSPSIVNTKSEQNQHKKSRKIPIISLLILSGCIFIGLFFGFNYLLKISAQQANQQLQSIMKES